MLGAAGDPLAVVPGPDPGIDEEFDMIKIMTGPDVHGSDRCIKLVQTQEEGLMELSRRSGYDVEDVLHTLRNGRNVTVNRNGRAKWWYLEYPML